MSLNGNCQTGTIIRHGDRAMLLHDKQYMMSTASNTTQIRVGDRSVTSHIDPPDATLFDAPNEYHEYVNSVTSHIDPPDVTSHIDPPDVTLFDAPNEYHEYVNSTSHIWRYNDPRFDRCQYVVLNVQYMLGRRLSAITYPRTWEDLRLIFGISEYEFSGVLNSPQWRMEVVRFCERRNITLDNMHLTLFGCHGANEITEDNNMPRREGVLFEVVPETDNAPRAEDVFVAWGDDGFRLDDYPDYNSGIIWREYPLAHIGANWTYDNLRTRDTCTVRIHVLTILNRRSNYCRHHSVGMSTPIREGLAWDFFLWYVRFNISRIK